MRSCETKAQSCSRSYHIECGRQTADELQNAPATAAPIFVSGQGWAHYSPECGHQSPGELHRGPATAALAFRLIWLGASAIIATTKRVSTEARLEDAESPLPARERR